MIGVTHDTATLYVDCKPVQFVQGSYMAPLEPRGHMDATGGYLSVARLVSEQWTVPVSKLHYKSLSLRFSYYNAFSLVLVITTSKSLLSFIIIKFLISIRIICLCLQFNVYSCF